MQIKLRSWHLVRESESQTRFFILMDSNLILQKDMNTLAMKSFFNGNLTHIAEALYEKSLKALFSLRRKLNNFQDVPVKVQIKLFDTLIRPILTYGAELWICDYNCKSNKLDCLPFEKLHNKFCKISLGVHKMSSNFACRWELGRSYLFDYILLQTFKCYDRLIHIPSQSIYSWQRFTWIKDEVLVYLYREICFKI